MSADGELRQILVHPAVWSSLETWLKGRGISLNLLPLDEDDLPTYVMTPDSIPDSALVKKMLCSWARMNYAHGPHAWEPQPGMGEFWCEGTVR